MPLPLGVIRLPPASASLGKRRNSLPIGSDRCVNSIELMESRLAVLGSKCGPILFQLPPNFRVNRERLEGFVTLLSAEYRYVFEFRHESWYDERIFQILRDHDIALCVSDHAAAPSPWIVTAQHVYVRGHGPTGRYLGKYPNATLQSWTHRIVPFLNEKRTARGDAKRLLQRLNRLGR